MEKINQKAFSLIEISMVLLIIALIIIGVTSGDKIINRARIIKMRDRTQNFSSLSFNKNLAFWIEPSIPNSYSISDSEIITISDKAVFDGKKTDVEAPSSDASPVYTDNVINGLPGFYFDGTDDYLSNNDVSFNSQVPHSIFFVILADSSVSSGAIYGFNNGGSNIEIMKASASSIAVTTSSGSYTLYSDTVGGIVILGEFITNGSTFKFYKNGTSSYSSSNTSLPDYSNAFYIGKEAGGNYFKGYIGEILIYNNVLNNSERQKVEEYLMAKWKIS